MSDDDNWQRFERVALPHLDAAYNLARWLIDDDNAAQHVLRQAFGRAAHLMHELSGHNARAGLLRIVRQACLAWLKENRGESSVPGLERPAATVHDTDRKEIDAAIAGLPLACREVLLLREFEDFSYAEIAQITDIPVETVMSRLSDAHGFMRAALPPPARPSQRSA